MKKKTSDSRFEDEELVSFLKTYYPNTPPETKPCEKLIMNVIAQHNLLIPSKSNYQQKTPQIISKNWLFSGTIIATLSLIIFGYFFNLNPRFSPQIATEKEDLEAFLVNSWYGSMAQEED